MYRFEATTVVQNLQSLLHHIWKYYWLYVLGISTEGSHLN